MTSFEVYLVMMADSFFSAMAIICTLFATSTALMIVFQFHTESKYEYGKVLVDTYVPTVINEVPSELSKFSLRWLKASSISFSIALLICTLIPSTKILAAMYILPKLTTPEMQKAIGSEAKDMYELAKKALQNAAGDTSNP